MSHVLKKIMKRIGVVLKKFQRARIQMSEYSNTHNCIHKEILKRLVPVKYSCHGLEIFNAPFPK